MKNLEIGCGRAKRPDAIGVDKFSGTDADLLADMDAGLPFGDNQFDKVFMIDSLEHAADVLATLAEVHRILKPGGRVIVRVPHFSSLHAYGDFTHRSFFSLEAIRQITGDAPQYGHYLDTRLSLVNWRIVMWRPWRLLGIEWFANRYPLTYEKFFAFSFTAMALEFTLQREQR